MDGWATFDDKYGAPFGKGAQCRVYRKGDLAIKALTPGHRLVDVMREAYALAIVESLGVPTSNLRAVYEDHGHLVMEMKYVTGRELMDVMLERAEAGDLDAVLAHLSRMADIQLQMHAAEAHGLESVRGVYRAAIAGAAYIDDAVKGRMLAALDDLPDGGSMCHNDYHPRNILYDGENYTVIDWDTASIGDPAGDVAHTYLATLLTSRDMADAYINLYIQRSGMDEARVRRWLPFHAATLVVTLRRDEKTAAHADVLLPFAEGLL